MDKIHIQSNIKYETTDFYYHESDDVKISDDGHVAHSHKHYEIFQVLDGNITCIIDSKIYKMKKGDVALVRPLDFHVIQVEGDVYVRRVLEFTPNALMMEQTARDLLLHPFRSGRKKFNNYLPAPIIEGSNFNQLFQKISEHAKAEKDAIVDVQIALLLSSILLTLHTLTKNNDGDDDYKNNVCHMIINYINKNITKRITLSDMERELNLSKYYLSHEFSKQMGIPIAKFIIEKKMLYAEQLIESGVSPTEASDMVAYNYPNFYTNYKRIFGHSPKERKK